ncbi:hypothetical protein DFA_00325 [Cavenderia fasciculata]|uniref:Ankyrin repeat-containing protein n=1 Tax=Cavenderia fasciculata TaxID=261658 RepID=F4PY87_CACFS|nr:uncharacterized protein DFA_00325 [Cavenderia fasciculata]EGG19747.1 hypothetical protein DFA_00325 [Cavenderia fasciculata]|eukprot:XP_004358041.1 hypothetical protein DFA_00325 [Cavenderia fasciculata]
MTSSTISFQSVFRNQTIRQSIFDHVSLISQQQTSIGNPIDKIKWGPHQTNISLQGKDIVKLPHLAMISKYAMPWDFIKHYLPPRENVLFERRMHSITKYCGHPNARLDTLLQLLEWSPDYNPNQDVVTGLEKTYYSLLAINVVKSGHSDILTYLMNVYPNINLNKTKESAAEFGYLLILQILDTLEKGGNYSTNEMNRAAKNGHLSVVEYLHNQGAKCTDIAMDYSACRGHFDVLKFLHFNRSEGCTTDAMDGAASIGNMEILKFLHENRTEGCTNQALNSAAENGHLEVLKFIHLNKSDQCWTKQVMNVAAFKNHLEIVEWLHYNRSEGCTTNAMDRTTSLDIVKFLHFNRTEGCTKDAMDFATIDMTTSLDIIKFLNENRSEGCTTYAIDNVVLLENNFNIINYLTLYRTEGGSKKALENAATSNFCDLDMIIFLHETLHIECTEYVLVNAADKGRLDVIEYFHRLYPHRSDIWTTSVMNRASYGGHLNIVKFLHLNRSEGCTTNAMVWAAQRNHLNIVQFLHENRTEGATPKAMDMAAANGYFDILKYLHYNRNEGCSFEALDNATKNGFVEIIEFLYQNRTEGCSYQVLIKPNSQVATTYDALKYLIDNNALPATLLPDQLTKYKEYSKVSQDYEYIHLIDQYYQI